MTALLAHVRRASLLNIRETFRRISSLFSGVRVTNVLALCHDLPQRSLVDGLLGLSFLKHCRMSIDFKRGILSIEPSGRRLES